MVSSIIFSVEANIPEAEALIEKLGIGPSGRTQRFFTDRIMSYSDTRVPFRTGVLKNTATVSVEGDAILYFAPYARYHYFGKLMVDPITGKGSFYDPVTGRHWSRPNTPKVLTDRDMEYNGAPERGPDWINRTWQADGETILKETEAFIGTVDL